ncbi:exodeoxyribonuclease V subunit alpha [Acinetobacter rudis]|uniref:exodeoxyribonuclease V subunit alpha n=1 Tax=Acinetobacter rudis TaxID=632955 RepID=UPI00333F2896
MRTKKKLEMDKSVDNFEDNHVENQTELVAEVDTWMIRWSQYLVQQVTGTSNEAAAQRIQQLLLALERGESCIAIDPYDPEQLQGIAVESQQLSQAVAPLVYNAENLYLYRYWQLEQQVAQHILRLKRQQISAVDISAYDSLLVDPHQHAALKMVASQGLSLITGGPGTGKTYTLARIIAVLNHLQPGLRIAMAAPTGKAAQRMKQALGLAFTDPVLNDLGLVDDTLRELETFTLHRLLGLGFHRPARFNAEHPLPYDLIVIDEASMLDLQLASLLLSAIATPCRLILLGDANQLASVDVGAVLADLQQVDILQPNRVNLITSRRFKAGALIGQMANFIQAALTLNMSSAQLISHFEQEVVAAGSLQAIELVSDMSDQIQLEFLASPMNNSLLVDYYQRLAWGFEHYFAALHQVEQQYQQLGEISQEMLSHLVAVFDQYRILVAVRHGDLGLHRLNLEMEQSLLSTQAEWVKQGDWYLGRPVMLTQNDDQLGLANGEVGICLPHREKAEQFEVYFPNLELWVAATRLPKTIETAFAMTIHKSQGSEFKHVAVVFDQAAQRLLSQELLYTAITRARSVVSLLVDRDTFAQSLQLKTRRRSGLVEKMTNSI